MTSVDTPLEALNQQFLEIATLNLTPEQKEFIASKWKRLRNYACQNAGIRRWGSHLLQLKKDQLLQLEDCFGNLIKGIEMNGFQLWKESGNDLHLEAIFRLFFDDEASLKDVDFSMGEKMAIFWKYDETIITQFRNRFEQIFKDFYHEMVWTQHDPLVAEMLIGNLIALYPLFDPEPGREVDLLQQIEGTWHLVRCRTDSIPLVEDKILAYGFTPLNNEKALPLILFRGTPYPAARGFWEAIKSDLHPFRSVGETLFIKGRKSIDAWMGDKPSVKCYGLSLGGALAYYLGNAYGERVTVHAYVPPGLLMSPKEMKKIHGAAYYHIDDFVPSLGYHPTGVNFTCYGVITQASRNFLLAHARPVGCNPTLVIEINPRHENQNVTRHLLTICKYALSSFLFILTLPIQIALVAHRLGSRIKKIWD
jgi:hypothetical protein